MQLGKKSKTTDMFERVRGDMGAEIDDTPLVAPTAASTTIAAEPVASRSSLTVDRDAIHVTVNEAISAKLARDGSLESLSVSGDLSLKISDASLTKVKLNLTANASHGAQFRTHPNVDRGLFTSSKVIQMSNTARGFPVNNSVGVLRWKATPKPDDTSALPINFTVWLIKGSGNSYTVTVEYELTGGEELRDVAVTIPFATSEPSVSSFDATYEVSGDSLEWAVGTVSDENASGAFEFDAQADDENEFFPMQIRFSKTTPFVDVDVSILLRSVLCTGVVRITNLITGRLGLVDRRERGGHVLEGHQVSCRQLLDRVGYALTTTGLNICVKMRALGQTPKWLDKIRQRMTAVNVVYSRASVEEIP